MIGNKLTSHVLKLGCLFQF